MIKQFRLILLTALILGLAAAPRGTLAQDTPSSATTPESVASASTPSESVTALAPAPTETGAVTAEIHASATPAATDTPRGAVLSPEHFQDLQETLAEMQSRLQGAVDAAGAAVADGQVTVEVPPMLSQDQVQDLLDTVSRLRWTLNDAMDVAGDLAVRAGEPQGTVIISTNQLIGMAVGATGAAVVVDLLGGGGIATATAAVVGAVGGYWVVSPETWTWAGADLSPSDGTGTPAPAPN